MQYTWNEIKASRLFYALGGYLLIFWVSNKEYNPEELLAVLTVFMTVVPLLAVANTAKSMQSNICRTYVATSLTRKGYLRSKFMIPLIITVSFFLIILGLGMYASNADQAVKKSLLTNFSGLVILGFSLITILVGFNTVFVLMAEHLRFGLDVIIAIAVNLTIILSAPRLIAFLGFGRTFPEHGINSIESITGVDWIIYDIALVKTFSGFIAVTAVTAIISFLLYKLGLRVFMKKDL